jgi:hypothetical protein
MEFFSNLSWLYSHSALISPLEWIAGLPWTGGRDLGMMLTMGRVMRKAVFAILGLIILTASAPGQGWAEKLFKEGVTYDFGVRPRGSQMDHSFPITNIYAVPLEITISKTSCTCVTASVSKRVLQPRESGTVDVRLDGARFSGPKTYTVQVTVGPQFVSTATLRLTANSRADIVFNPGQVTFGTVTRGQTPVQSIDVEYAGRLDFQISEVLAQEVPYTASISEMYRRPGQVGYRLQVALKADAPVGTHKHYLYLRTNDPASPLVPVLVESNVESSLSVTPSTLSLGEIKTGVPHIRRVVIRGNKNFRILGVQGTGDGIEIEGALPAMEETVHFLTFKCKLDNAGAFRREVKIRTTMQETPITVLIEGNASR